MSSAKKLEHLRRIQYLLDHTRRLHARDAELTEAEFLALEDEGLTFFRDDGEVLDIHDIEKITPKGVAVLANAHLAKPEPLQVTVVIQPKSFLRRIYEGTRSGLWDLIKIAVGAAIGWWLKKHSGQP